ncbi:MAG: carbohydrate kinase family protein [Bacteroidetes bacterium]|nr:carbohydrate kinase family protein [Bacteroidota bacterium]
MVITVIGHICNDILPPQSPHEKSREQFGGIFYTIAALATLIDESDILYPVFGVGNGDYDRLMNLLSRYKNIETRGIFKFKGITNTVYLSYHNDKQSRTECSRDIAAPIPFQRIKPYLDCDGILINMVSGFDITLETLDAIRIETRDQRIPIHFDFHSLTLGIDHNHVRFRRPLTDWRRWCFMLHSIQMSEEEAAGLTAEKFDETTLINHLMPLMVNTLLITRGEKGVSVISQDIHKKLSRRDIPGIPTDNRFINPTGCGDVFGAAYLYAYLKTRNSFTAAEFANAIASLNTTLASAEDFDTLREQITTLKQELKVAYV